MSTQKLPWQSEIWASFAAGLREDRTPHGLLIAGSRGVGKRALAERLTAALLCEARGADGDACGQCRGCRLLAAGQHPNLQRLSPEEGKRDIAMDAIRELIERLALTSHYGGRKLALIDPADALNISSVNALLKTLEEPPAGSHLILITERLQGLPATLRSRCQILRLAPPPAAEADAWMAAHCAEVPKARRDAFRRKPLALAQSEADPARWSRCLEDALAGRAGEAVRGLKDLKRDEAEAMLPWLLEQFAARMRSGGAQAAAAAELIPEVVEAQRRLAGNASPQLLAESLMIRVTQKFRTGVSPA